MRSGWSGMCAVSDLARGYMRGRGLVSVRMYVYVVRLPPPMAARMGRPSG